MRDALAAGTRLGPYEIDSLIGAGGMGQVYRARDPRLGRSVAIKTLYATEAADPGFLARFELEARAAGALEHPNLLVVYDVGRDRGVSFIVSELLDGETLRLRLAGGVIPARLATDYAAQIARGLAAAHAKGIVHRDLKPENLFLTRDGRVKILDFGVAKLLAPEGNATVTIDVVTAVGAVVGTVGYMAPEQVRGQAIDHRTDIFALGIVLHEVLSGTRPFKRDTSPETLSAILNEDPPTLPAGVPPALQRIVGRCLEKRPDDRFHSAHDLGLALELVSTVSTTAVTPAMDRAPEISRRKVLLYGVSSVALLASGLAGGAYVGRTRKQAALPSYRRLTFRRGLIRSARVAPDGQTFLYGALWDGNPCRVHMGRMDGPESNAIDLPEANLLAISKSGELALALGPHLEGVITYGTLARVPISGGTPRELLNDVKFADWSPDGSDLAIIRRVDGRDRMEFPIGKVLVEPKADDRNGIGLGFPRVSPDGQHVAFVHYRTPETLFGRVSVSDLTGRVTVLSDEYLNIHGLAWKGDEVWYTAAADAPLFRTLQAVRPVNGDRRTITRMPGNVTLWDVLPDGRLLLAHTDDRSVMIAKRPEDVRDRDLSWLDGSNVDSLSDDGRWLLFSEYGQAAGQGGGMYLRGMDGSLAVRLSDGRSGGLSPDGQWAISFSTAFPSPYLEIMPTRAGDRRRLPDNGLVYISARWLSDGKRIVVWAKERDRSYRLYVLTLDGGRPTAITPENLRPWTVSPDGSHVAAVGPGPAIVLYPIDGSPAKALPGTTGRETVLDWIDEGLLVVPNDSSAPRGEVHKIDPRTGRRQPWRNILPSDPAGIMGVGSFRATHDGRTQAYTWHRALSSLYLADGF